MRANTAEENPVLEDASEMDFRMKLHEFFQRIVLINLDRRRDRLDECYSEMDANNIPRDKVERFAGHDHPTSGHCGCTRSHRMLLRQIAQGDADRVLILEDDFAAVTRARLLAAGFTDPNNPVWKTHCELLQGLGDLNVRFNCLIPWLPSEWDCLFLGGGYAENPIGRFNKHVVRCAGMKGTGSVGVTKEFAKKFTEAADAEGDLEHHVGPIDDFYSRFSKSGRHYVLQPRLVFQRESLSDISGQKTSYLYLGTDPVHENSI